MALLLKHQTIEQFVSRLREAYRTSEQDRNIQLCEFIITKIQAAEITDSQCQAAFEKSVGQWNALKAKMNTRIAAKQAVRSAVGE